MFSNHAMQANFLPRNLRARVPLKDATIELTPKSEELIALQTLRRIDELALSPFWRCDSLNRNDFSPRSISLSIRGPSSRFLPGLGASRAICVSARSLVWSNYTACVLNSRSQVCRSGFVFVDMFFFFLGFSAPCLLFRQNSSPESP
jgi:hypothetical protein